MVNSWPLWIIDAKTTQKDILRLPVISRNREHEIWLKRIRQFVPDDRAAEGDGGERGARCLFLYLCTEGIKNNILLCCSYVTTTQQKTGTVLYSCSPFFIFILNPWIFRCLHPEPKVPPTEHLWSQEATFIRVSEIKWHRRGLVFLACVIILASAGYFSHFAPHSFAREGWNVSQINEIYLTCLSQVQSPTVNI